MTAPAIVGQLVERFESHREAYRSGRYNEAQVRQEFLNPLFEALGWDVHNRIQRQIETVDRRIDRLVYELYDLTDDEIAIVEEASE